MTETKKQINFGFGDQLNMLKTKSGSNIAGKVSVKGNKAAD